MATKVPSKQRRLVYQTLEARQLMHGESIAALPEVDVRQTDQPVQIASALPQRFSLNMSQEVLAMDGRFGGIIIPQDTSPPDTVDWAGVIPRLSSNPGASATIYLDFNGHSEEMWGLRNDIETPKFDIDNDLSGYSAAENLMMQNIWARVAEDFVPFNINVTTVDPGSFKNGEALRIAIGGHWEDWYDKPAGGLASRNAFTNDVSNVAFVFSGTLNDGADTPDEEPRLAQWIADAASHEAGHSFGLAHQSYYRTRNGITVKEEYRKGNSQKGPIMGSTFFSDRSVWYYGKTGPAAQITYQDDMAIIAGTKNGFGYRADDHGDSLSDATEIPWGTTTVSGIVEQTSDVDVFRFDTDGGQITIDLDVVTHGANLDARIELWGTAPQVSSRTFPSRSIDASDFTSTPRLLASSDPADALDASITKNIDAGTYYVKVLSHGEYGDVGQYKLGGDLNLKRNANNPINGTDLLAWQRGFGTVDARRSDGDVDKDLHVDGDDLAVWQTQYGKTAPVVYRLTSPIVGTDDAVEPRAKFQANTILGSSVASVGVGSTAPRQKPLEAIAVTELSEQRIQSAWHALPEQTRDLGSDDFASARDGHSTKATEPVDAAFVTLDIDKGFTGLRFASVFS
ncbi:zinc metalloprotease [Adhaeretor mobilis]|uniref:Uncharacterized protein n=1 Tax=Adhaeretor mobilis TaxID=1930276 RepID=A0A517MQ56_9BACT|nr:hypothetical protein [Adhaeretor mobilis]QDS97020.1 hypothetical protein HG15A2_02790 [Adhaeretor mobilis]